MKYILESGAIWDKIVKIIVALVCSQDDRMPRSPAGCRLQGQKILLNTMALKLHPEGPGFIVRTVPHKVIDMSNVDSEPQFYQICRVADPKADEYSSLR